MGMIDNICNLLGVTFQSSNDLEKIKVNQSATAVTHGYYWILYEIGRLELPSCTSQCDPS